MKAEENEPEISETLIMTVNDLRKSLKGVAGDQQVAVQLVATDGKAWRLYGKVVPKVKVSEKGRPITVLTVSHPDLTTLPKITYVK